MARLGARKAKMARFFISFNDGDMKVADDEWQQVADDSHAVVREFIDDPESVN